MIQARHRGLLKNAIKLRNLFSQVHSPACQWAPYQAFVSTSRRISPVYVCQERFQTCEHGSDLTCRSLDVS